MIATLEDRIDDTAARMGYRNLEVWSPDRIELTQDILHHPGLMPIREPRTSSGIDTNGDVRAEGGRVRDKGLEARTRQSCLDPADEGSVDTGSAGGLRLRGPGIDSDALELLADVSFDPAHPGPDDAG